MKIITLAYQEGVPHLVKWGFPPFYITIELDPADLPGDTLWRQDGVKVWRDLLSPLEIVPDALQRLDGWSHQAQLFWHDRADAIRAFEALKQLQ